MRCRNPKWCLGVPVGIAFALACASCSSPGSTSTKSSGSSGSVTTSPTSPTGSSASTATTGNPTGASSTTATSAAATAPGIEVQIYPTGVLFTIESHVSDLSSSISDPHFSSSTEFDFSLTGVTIPLSAASTTTSASGVVSSVVLVAGSADTAVRIVLRSAETNDQISVGAGDGIQVTFS